MNRICYFRDRELGLLMLCNLLKVLPFPFIFRNILLYSSNLDKKDKHDHRS